MTNCDPRIEEFMEAVESEKIRASREVKALVSHVRSCFKNEDIYTDSEQLTKYIGIAKYFPFEKLFPWQIFVVGLHDCTYWRVSKTPRWPDLFCMLGRGAGKDGTIAWESACLVSPYNGRNICITLAGDSYCKRIQREKQQTTVFRQRSRRQYNLCTQGISERQKRSP